MNLLSSLEDSLYSFIEALVLAVNNHADSKKYAIVIARSKINKKSLKRKIWLRCDREDKLRESKDMKRVHEITKLQKCSFKAIAKRTNAYENDDDWKLIVKNSSHNHSSTLSESHSALRKIALNEKIMNSIQKQFRANIASAQILSILRLDKKEENSMFKSQNIYNAKMKIKRKKLDALTSVQTLMKQLNEGNWMFRYDTDENDQILILFFSRVFSQKMLKLNPEILIMNCTYKTNIYKMSLLIITKQTAINTTFYVTFVFLSQENEIFYSWALEQLKELYRLHQIPASSVIVTDCETGLISIMKIVYSEISHLFCVWHINNNVLTQCRKKFDTLKAWQEFFNRWKTMIYASTLKQYETVWNMMHNLYHVSHSRQIEYLFEIYLRLHKQKFVTYWIDQMLHFFSTVTFRDEDSHAVLKRCLKSSIDE